MKMDKIQIERVLFIGLILGLSLGGFAYGALRERSSDLKLATIIVLYYIFLLALFKFLQKKFIE